MQKRVLLSWSLVVVHCTECVYFVFFSPPCCMFLFSISPPEIRVTLPLYFSTLPPYDPLGVCFLSSFPSFLCSLLFFLLPSFIQQHSFTHTTILHTPSLLLFSSLLPQLIPSLPLHCPHCSPFLSLPFPSLPSNPCVFSSRFYFLSPLSLSLSLAVTLSTVGNFFSYLSRSLFSPPHFWAYLPLSLSNLFLRLTPPPIRDLIQKRDT